MQKYKNLFNAEASDLISRCTEYDWFDTEEEATRYARMKEKYDKQAIASVRKISDEWFVFVK